MSPCSGSCTRNAKGRGGLGHVCPSVSQLTQVQGSTTRGQGGGLSEIGRSPHTQTPRQVKVQTCPGLLSTSEVGIKGLLAAEPGDTISLPDGLFMSLKPSYCHRRPVAENTALPPGRGPGKSSGQGQWTPQPAWRRAPPGAWSGLVSFSLLHSLISQIPPRMPTFALWAAASGRSGL